MFVSDLVVTHQHAVRMVKVLFGAVYVLIRLYACNIRSTFSRVVKLLYQEGDTLDMKNT